MKCKSTNCSCGTCLKLGPLPECLPMVGHMNQGRTNLCMLYSIAHAVGESGREMDTMRRKDLIGTPVEYEEAVALLHHHGFDTRVWSAGRGDLQKSGKSVSLPLCTPLPLSGRLPSSAPQLHPNPLPPSTHLKFCARYGPCIRFSLVCQQKIRKRARARNGRRVQSKRVKCE